MDCQVICVDGSCVGPPAVIILELSSQATCKQIGLTILQKGLFDGWIQPSFAHVFEYPDEYPRFFNCRDIVSSWNVRGDRKDVCESDVRGS